MDRWIERTVRGLNWIAAGCVTAMMLLTVVDVVLRLFRRPITGAYEIVGLLGALFVSFSLAQTSVERGHIAVDFLIQKLPPRIQAAVDGLNDLVCTILFAMVTWQCIKYAADIRAFGEVSMTLQVPIYPFIYGIAIGCGMLCLVLTMNLIRSIQGFARGLP
ncbi:MAG: TRAP transporter small permease [Desulfobacterales bacterium]|nr:TRAP transporter small permease [Desulfobacterales bacterium]